MLKILQRLFYLMENSNSRLDFLLTAVNAEHATARAEVWQRVITLMICEKVYGSF